MSQKRIKKSSAQPKIFSRPNTEISPSDAMHVLDLMQLAMHSFHTSETGDDVHQLSYRKYRLVTR
uniref:Uncharacterized protein n=1 Tax=Setaria italica TaxID=4555 RepID=K3ZYV3_SETIT